jgi:PhnB protein
MTLKHNPHFNFKDNAHEAMKFCMSGFGGKLNLQTIKEFNASQNPCEDNKSELTAFFQDLSTGGRISMPL